MAPVDPTTTTRYKVTYAGPFGTHNMTFHGLVGDTVATLRAKVEPVVTAMAALSWGGTAWNAGQFAAAGSTLFFPDSGWTTITGGSGVFPDATSSPARFVQFGGRSPDDGTRVKLYVFETFMTDRNDMRYQRGERAEVDAVLDALQAFGLNLATISGAGVSWYDYANVNDNDNLVHKARR